MEVLHLPMGTAYFGWEQSSWESKVVGHIPAVFAAADAAAGRKAQTLLARSCNYTTDFAMLARNPLVDREEFQYSNSPSCHYEHLRQRD